MDAKRGPVKTLYRSSKASICVCVCAFCVHAGLRVLRTCLQYGSSEASPGFYMSAGFRHYGFHDVFARSP